MFRFIFTTAALLLATAGAFATEVYDNFSTPAGTIHVLLPAGAAASEEHGNRISLAPGIERASQGIQFRMRIEGAGPATFQYRVRLYQLDGPDGAPGTPFYESPWRNGGIDSGAEVLYQVLPGELVLASECAWTVEIRNRTGNMSAMGPAHYGPPAIGGSESGYWNHLADGTWQQVDDGSLPFGGLLLGERFPGDTDGDCDVDLSDLTTLLGYFGTNGQYGPEYGDSQNDGDVDIADLALLLTWFGAACR